MYQARTIVTGYEQRTGAEQKQLQAFSDNIDTKWVENWYDGLTYCRSCPNS